MDHVFPLSFIMRALLLLTTLLVLGTSATPFNKGPVWPEQYRWLAQDSGASGNSTSELHYDGPGRRMRIDEYNVQDPDYPLHQGYMFWNAKADKVDTYDYFLKTDSCEHYVSEQLNTPNIVWSYAKLIGHEVVDNIECDHYRVEGGMITHDLFWNPVGEAPVRSKMSMGKASIETKYLAFEKMSQPDVLFKVPLKCAKTEIAVPAPRSLQTPRGILSAEH